MEVRRWLVRRWWVSRSCGRRWREEVEASQGGPKTYQLYTERKPWSVAEARGEIPPAVIFRSRFVSPSSQLGTVQIIIAMSHFTCAKLNRMGRVI